MKLRLRHSWILLVKSFSYVVSDPSQPSRSRGKLIFSVSVSDGQSSCMLVVYFLHAVTWSPLPHLTTYEGSKNVSHTVFGSLFRLMRTQAHFWVIQRVVEMQKDPMDSYLQLYLIFYSRCVSTYLQDNVALKSVHRTVFQLCIIWLNVPVLTPGDEFPII